LLFCPFLFEPEDEDDASRVITSAEFAVVVDDDEDPRAGWGEHSDTVAGVMMREVVAIPLLETTGVTVTLEAFAFAYAAVKVIGRQLDVEAIASSYGGGASPLGGK
jgi:hypothetical protein